VIDGSPIAISVIILTAWFTTGTPDDSSKISFYALVISLPMLVTDLTLIQMPHIQFQQIEALAEEKSLKVSRWILP
jgi:hypothetical protein